MVKLSLLALSLLATGCSTIAQQGGLSYLNLRAYTVPPTYTEEHPDFNGFMYNNALQGNIRF